MPTFAAMGNPPNVEPAYPGYARVKIRSTQGGISGVRKGEYPGIQGKYPGYTRGISGVCKGEYSGYARGISGVRGYESTKEKNNRGTRVWYEG